MHEVSIGKEGLVFSNEKGETVTLRNHKGNPCLSEIILNTKEKKETYIAVNHKGFLKKSITRDDAKKSANTEKPSSLSEFLQGCIEGVAIQRNNLAD